MPKRLTNNLVEFGFVSALLALCAVLVMLQYHWTGEVSRAETEKLRGETVEQSQHFCNAFDGSLSDSCGKLRPRGENLNDTTRDEVHFHHYLEWRSSSPRPLFQRICIAVPSVNDIQLFSQNLVTGHLSLIDWPLEWQSLRLKFLSLPWNGPRSFNNLNGTLIEFPTFGGKPGGNPPPDEGEPPSVGNRPGENEWMIFELDTNYITKTWFPELAHRYFDVGGKLVNDLAVKTISPPIAVIYLSAPFSQGSATVTKIRFNHQGSDPLNLQAPGSDYRWALEVTSRPGAIESIVAASRFKNASVAIFLNLLIFFAGIAFFQYTRKSRQFAQQQIDFVAGVSHELRTPLTVIRGAAHNLESGVVHDPAKIAKYSHLITQHCEHLTDMIENVLSLAGAQKGNSVYLRDKVNLVEILRAAVEATAHDAIAAQCHVQIELPPTLPEIVGDASALRRLFQNLITNAARHGGSGKWIGVTAFTDEESDPTAVEIQVADRGPGISETEISAIFEPFYRSKKTRVEQIRGSGLGLSLVKEIVVAHGGNIFVRNSNQQGATFVIRFPVILSDKKQ